MEGADEKEKSEIDVCFVCTTPTRKSENKKYVVLRSGCRQCVTSAGQSYLHLRNASKKVIKMLFVVVFVLSPATNIKRREKNPKKHQSETV